ncbi:hypothetical protein K7432_004122 [Basidiobolus ranarum]|uniref:Uncharacterized protein n=1 Tax=Basidiobolus ranarum TaxID=34480 RepID=A0ABR2W520_9FUNG
MTFCKRLYPKVFPQITSLHKVQPPITKRNIRYGLSFINSTFGRLSSEWRLAQLSGRREYSVNQFSNCNTPTQLRSHINRYLYKQPQPMSSYIVSALYSCSDMAAHAKDSPPKRKDEIDSFLSQEKNVTEQIFEIASELFAKVKDTPALNLSVYNAYLEVCVNTWQVEEAFKVYKDMRQRRYVPEVKTFELMILCTLKARDIHQALEAVELGTQDISHSIYTRRRMKVGMRMGIGALCGGWLTITLGMLLPNVAHIEGMGVAVTIFFCLRSGATGLFSTIPVMKAEQIPFDIHTKYRVNIHDSLMDDIYKYFYQYLLLHLPSHGNNPDLNLVTSDMKSKGLLVDERSLVDLRKRLSG